MSSTDQYLHRYKDKSSSELNDIVRNDGYLTEAKIAAILELEKREEITGELQSLKNKLEAELERIIVQRRNNQRYQTLFPRIIAAIIDSIVLWPIGLLLNYLMKLDILFAVLLLNLINNLLPFIYSIFCHGRYGQTIGKYAMNVKVIDIGEQKSIDFGQALLRDIVPVALTLVLFIYSIFMMDYSLSGEDLLNNLSILLPMIILSSLSILWAILEIFSMLTNKKSRAIHDLIAGTVVVKQL